MTRRQSDPVRSDSSIHEPDIIKRAFDLARECGSLNDLKRRLILEGYFHVNAHLTGWQIRRDLSRMLNPKLAQQVPKRIWEVVEG